MKAKTPFEFYTSSQLVEITGQKAGDLKEFLESVKGLDDSSIFYHVHHAFREHQFAPGAYTNDFAHWVETEVGEHALAERLANINIKDYTELAAVRSRIVEILEAHLSRNTAAAAKHGFYFCRNIGIIMKTGHLTWDYESFCTALKRVGLRSLFFHFFEARLRLGKKSNDFSSWIKDNFGNEELARQIEALDPYIYTMDQLRDEIIALVRRASRQDRIGGILKWLKIR
ncbi:MAG: hypothetical protein JW873_02400 [Candidatus Saganbacteria bacterium]|nr:hypothetical protein [Candidatus Saganbacteria bacterium]